ncbi:uncharacterized protein LOC118438559 [Folsomia candida]|uniref:Threonine--tRNA ligase n=1 Tax=Folsomia candida TaxID=158441 RepID=A0A226DCI8_FOLCA|nr:uncharacterized protein LOC118438559 [Folsomia candida]OXA43242.1 Threonine--tRNA ligase [Folsomia candida]
MQVGLTCYANAVAAAIHLATRMVSQGEGGYPHFDDILKKIVTEFGENGADTDKVLQKYAPEYRLRYRNLADEEQARLAVSQGRPVIARFWLYKEEEGRPEGQWGDFEKFFKDNPIGVLTKKDLRVQNTGRLGRHVVLLVDYEPNALVFMNSWGIDFADGGYFRVENADVLGLEFYDVFFHKSDLSKEEIQAYGNQGSDPSTTGSLESLSTVSLSGLAADLPLDGEQWSTPTVHAATVA